MHRKCNFGTFTMDCALGVSSSGFHATPKKLLGVPASFKGPVIPIFGSRRTDQPLLDTNSGHRQPRGSVIKNIPESKMGGGRCFYRSYWPVGRPGNFCTARLFVIDHSAHPPCLFPGARQVGSRGKVLVGLGNGRARKFLCGPRAPR